MINSYNSHHSEKEKSDDYCNTTHAAKLLNLSVGTVQRLVEKNELDAWRTQGGHRRISIQSINDYMLKNNFKFSVPEPREKHFRILLIENDFVTCEMIQKYCERSALAVDCTAMSSIIQALVNISSINPDLLITDIDTQGIDGFELIRTIRENPQFKKMIIFVLSTLSENDILARGEIPERCVYIKKPLKGDWLHGFFRGIKISNEK